MQNVFNDFMFRNKKTLDKIFNTVNQKLYFYKYPTYK